MANASAIRFVKNLVATFHRFPVAPEAKDRLTFKLSKWKFPDQGWERILDLIAENRKEEDKGMPEYPEIRSAISLFLTEKAKIGSFGMLSWRDPKTLCDYAEPMRHDGSVWVSTRTGLFFTAPKGAIDIVFTPNDPAPSKAGDMPTDAEKREFMRQINANLSKVK